MVIKVLLNALVVGLFFISSCWNSFSQWETVERFEFHPPLDIPLVLAANFGELRTNHFHTGIDFKTNRRIGYKIYAIEDGFVSRIKISPWGYGHAIYIDHPNGLTSVYAHCDEFVGEIGELVSHRQKLEQNFAFEYYPPKDSLQVKRGQVIAKSGNTGGSTAPHLHFEIRDTKSENALNPLLFDFEIKDTRRPTIRGVKVYAVTMEGYRVPNKAKVLNAFGANGKYSISGNTLTIPANYTSTDGGIGLAFDAIDQLDAADNVCGIFKAFLIIDGDTVFVQDMTRIAFESNRYINCHKDYEEFHTKRRHYQKTYKTIHNPLPIYAFTQNNGILKMQPGEQRKVEYSCVDTEGNKASLHFTLVAANGESSNWNELYSPSDAYLFPDSAFMENSPEGVVLFPLGLVYEPTSLIYKSSDALIFGNPAIPLQEKFKVMLPIKNQSLPDEKYLIARKHSNGVLYPEIGTVKDGWITSWVKNFGTFSVTTDTIAPVISARNFSNNSNVKGKTLLWAISDNFSGIADYDVFVDGEWFVLKYEPKRAAGFSFTPPSHLTGKKEVLVRAIDYCGNVQEVVYQLSF